jgi:anaerobic selenocysteine-containing dehydrogenase
VTDTVVRTVCPHDCPDLCSILATVRDGRLVAVRGDPDHAFTRGFLCGKVQHYEERVHSPARLLSPLRRVGPKGTGQFAEVGWDEALDEIAARWRRVIAEHGSEAVVGYAYGANQGLVNRNVVRALFHALGASRFNPGTVCDSACAAGWAHAVGGAYSTDPEAVVDSDLVIAWGANLATTNVHMLPLVDDARARGAQLVVIDPFRTRTARRADWYLAPRVGTDAALALGLMHVIVRDGRHDADYVARRTVGFEQLRDEVLAGYAPDRVAEITGLAADDVERLADLYARARAPFLRLGMGMSRHRHGGMAIRTIACLPALVGAWGKPGAGALLDTSGIWGWDLDALRRPDLAPRRTREINHSLLGRALCELDDPPIKALFVASNNPAVTCPDQARVLAGLARDDLFTVVHECSMTDTARYADFVLPASTAMESDDLFRSYGTYYCQYGPKLIEPLGQSRSNLELVQALAASMGLVDPFFRRTRREYFEMVLATATGPTGQLDLDRLLRGGPIKLAVGQDGPEITYFRSDALAAEGLPDLPEWRPDPAEADAAGFPLRLLTGPGHFQHHTVLAGVARLQRREGEASCLLHPDDAAKRGIADGAQVVLHNERGEVAFRARVTSDAQAGTVVVIGQRGTADHPLGRGSVNRLVADALSDMGEGATYQSTWVEARLLPGDARPSDR